MRHPKTKILFFALLTCTIVGCDSKKSFTNSLGMKYVDVPDTNLKACIHETRIADYGTFVKATGHRGGTVSLIKLSPRKFQVAENPSKSRGEDHPITNLRSSDANAFCEWLTAKEIEEGIIDSNQSYRLPTSEEWDQMLDAGMEVRTKYPWGDSWPPPPLFGNYLDGNKSVGWDEPIPGYKDGFSETAPVMSYGPNLIGLYDMSGNVWEMCIKKSISETVYCLRGGSYIDSKSSIDSESSLESRALLEIEKGGYNPTSAAGFRTILVGSQ